MSCLIEVHVAHTVSVTDAYFWAEEKFGPELSRTKDGSWFWHGPTFFFNDEKDAAWFLLHFPGTIESQYV